MSTVLLFHDRLATTVLLFFIVVGLWGILEFARGGAIGGNIAGAFIIGQGLVVVQVLLGVTLLIGGLRPAAMLHILYGAVLVVILPFVWSYVRDRAPRQGLLLYSIVALFMAGLAVRAMLTGS